MSLELRHNIVLLTSHSDGRMSDGRYRYSWTKNGEKLSWDAVKISRPDSTVGSIEITDASEQDVGYYQCFVTGNYGTAMSHVTQLVMGVLDEFTGGETVNHNKTTEYSKFSLPCKAPRSIPDAEYFWSYQTSSSSTGYIPIQLDARRQVDQHGTSSTCDVIHFMCSTDVCAESVLITYTGCGK